jgi:hypothetical protein
VARELSIFVEGNSASGRKALDETANSVDKLRRETSRLEHEFAQAKREAASLDRQLLETAAATKALNAEFAKTGDKAVLAQLRAQKSELSQIAQVRKDYTTSLKDGKLAQIANHEAAIAALKSEYLLFAPSRVKADIKERQSSIKSLQRDLQDLGVVAEKAGLRLGDAFSGGLMGLLKSPGGIAAAAAVAIPAIVGIGATIGGAIGAGVGAGAAGLTVAGAAAQSKAVHAAWSRELDDIKREFLDATSPGVEPTIAAIHRIGAAVKGLNMDQIFGDASKFIEPLTKGLAEGLTATGKGIEYLVHRAGPFVDALSSGAAEIGHGFEFAFKEIADGSQGGSAALRDFLHGITIVIEGTGRFIHWMESAYNATDRLAGKLRTLPQVDLMAKFFGDRGPTVIARTLDNITLAADGTAKGVAKTAEDFARLSAILSATANNADTLAGAMTDKVLGSMLDSDHATLSWNESLTHLRDAFKENKKSLDIHTAAGQADREAVLAAVEANKRIYDVMIASGSSAEEAAIAYGHNTDALAEQLRQAGLTQQQIEGLIGKYRDVPSEVNTNIAMEGLTKAINDLADLIAKINHVDNKNFHSTYTMIYKTQGHPPIGEQGTIPRVGGYASGTPSAPPGWAWTGENGPELMRLRGGEKILNPAQSKALMSAYAPSTSAARLASKVAASSAVAGVNVSVSMSGGQSDFDGFMKAWFLKQIQTGQIAIKASAVIG